MVVDLFIVVIEGLLKVLADKDEVDTTEAQLGDAQEHINQSSGCRSESSQPWATRSCEASLSHIRIGQEWKVGPPAELLRGVDQYVHAVDADGGHEHQA